MPEPVDEETVTTAAGVYMEALNQGAHHHMAMRAALEAVSPPTADEIDEAMAEASQRLREKSVVARYRLVPVDTEEKPWPENGKDHPPGRCGDPRCGGEW